MKKIGIIIGILALLGFLVTGCGKKAQTKYVDAKVVEPPTEWTALITEDCGSITVVTCPETDTADEQVTHMSKIYHDGGELHVTYKIQIGGWYFWNFGENRPEVIAYYDAKKPDKKPLAENKPEVKPEPKIIPNPAKIEVPGTRKPKSIPISTKPDTKDGYYTLTNGTVLLRGSNEAGRDTAIYAFFDKLETSIKDGEHYKTIEVNPFEQYFKSDFGSK